VQADIRDAAFEPATFDIILAAAVLHHLREPAEWDAVFLSMRRWLRPGGALSTTWRRTPIRRWKRFRGNWNV
jgi:tRNA (cmo5U34)-methyltransferase